MELSAGAAGNGSIRAGCFGVGGVPLLSRRSASSDPLRGAGELGEWKAILREVDEVSLYGPHHGTMMFRKEAYVAAGGYRKEFYFAQDLDLWTRLSEFGQLRYVNSVLLQIGYSHNCISARYGAQQRFLRQLIVESGRRRRAGGSEAGVLAQAEAIRPGKAGGPEASSADADYFIGSCLLQRADPAARGYLWRVIKGRPFMWRAWLKLSLSLLKHHRAPGEQAG